MVFQCFFNVKFILWLFHSRWNNLATLSPDKIIVWAVETLFLWSWRNNYSTLSPHQIIGEVSPFETKVKSGKILDTKTILISKDNVVKAYSYIAWFSSLVESKFSWILFILAWQTICPQQRSCCFPWLPVKIITILFISWHPHALFASSNHDFCQYSAKTQQIFIFSQNIHLFTVS